MLIGKQSKVMSALLFFLVIIMSAGPLIAQDTETELDELNYFPEIGLLLRSALEVPLNSDNPAAIRLNEARIAVVGDILPNLSYGVRYRLNSTQLSNSFDNSPGSLDWAYVDYLFGSSRKFSLRAGKQPAFVGNWEFENNPTFEYRYSEFVNFQTNIFLMAIKLGYQANENHAFHMQLHNTFNDGFDARHAQFEFDPNGLESAKFPLGAYFSWLGNFAGDKFKTFWSYNIAQYAKGEPHHSIALGQKVIVPKFVSYLDFTYSNYAVDYPGIISQSYNSLTGDNVFARDANYFTAVIRADYNFAHKFFITVKGILENSSISQDNFDRQNLAGLVGLEYKPFDSESMRLFSYYYANRLRSTLEGNNTDQSGSLFAIGILYNVLALKNPGDKLFD